MYVHTHMNQNAHIHICIQKYTYPYIHIYKNVHTHIYKNVHTHMCIQIMWQKKKKNSRKTNINEIQHFSCTHVQANINAYAASIQSR
jgi:hypothetical protein